MRRPPLRAVIALAAAVAVSGFSMQPTSTRLTYYRPAANTNLLIDFSSSRSGTSDTVPRSSTILQVATSTVMEGVKGDANMKPSFPVILWRFTRPHTIIGSALAIPALHMLAAPSLSLAFSVPNVVSMLYAMVPALLMNLYITGLNQITDVEIDKINKPDLPIAAGLLTPRDAKITVVIALIASLVLGMANPLLGTQGLNVALWGSAILGTLYSMEPFRLKRFPFLAAFCIVVVRGSIINAGFFAHAKAAAFGQPAATVLGCLMNDPKCLLSSLFFAVFGVVIALMKDVPDVLGDRTLNIRTLSVRIGQTRVFTAMRYLLTGTFWACGAAFLQRAVTAQSARVAAARTVVGLASVLFGWSVRKESASVDPMNSEQVYKYYMHLWKLFYLSYLVLPFAM
jgi:homogentisate phytyltransferase/homogentisate geranylgeranyltransferase